MLGVNTRILEFNGLCEWIMLYTEEGGDITEDCDGSTESSWAGEEVSKQIIEESSGSWYREDSLEDVLVTLLEWGAATGFSFWQDLDVLEEALVTLLGSCTSTEGLEEWWEDGGDSEIYI